MREEYIEGKTTLKEVFAILDACEAANLKHLEERDEYYAGYQLLMTRCAVLTNLLRDMFPLMNKDLLDEKDRAMLVSCNDRYLALVEGGE